MRSGTSSKVVNCQGSVSDSRLLYLCLHECDCPVVGGEGDSAYECAGGRKDERCRCFSLRLMWRFVIPTSSPKHWAQSNFVQAGGIWRALRLRAGIRKERQGASGRPTQILRESSIWVFRRTRCLCVPTRTMGHGCRKGQIERPRGGER